MGRTPPIRQRVGFGRVPFFKVRSMNEMVCCHNYVLSFFQFLDC